MQPKSYLVSCTILLLLSHANLSAGKNTADDPALDDPAMTVVRVLDKLEAFSNTVNNTNPDKLHNFIRGNILSHFAIREMSQWISGPYSHHMSIKDKNEFQQQLENAYLNIILNNIGSFKTIKTRVQIQPTQYKKNNDAVVGTQIKLYNNTSIQLDLHLRRIESRWKIIDVRTNGISALIYYRYHFMSQLRAYARKQESH